MTSGLDRKSGHIGSLCCKYFLTINDLYNGAKIVNLPLVVVEIWLVLDIKLWLPVWTGSKGQIGSLFCKYFLTSNDLYNGTKSLNLPLVVVEIWLFLYIFGQEVEVKNWVKIWSCLCTKCDIIQGLYDNAKIVNLSGVVHEIWFLNMLNLYLTLFDLWWRHHDITTSLWH